MGPAANPDPLAGYDPSTFPPFAVTVDVVVLAVINADLHVALIHRGEAPHRGAWALPGGFKRPEETLDAAANRASSVTARARRNGEDRGGVRDRP